MRWQRILLVLCILLLFSLATAGCTVSLNPPNVQVNPSQSPLGVNSTETSNGTAHMLAVEQADNNSSYTGAVSDVIVYAQPGTGHIFVETAPLTGVDFQATARDVINVAAQLARINPNQRDFEFVLHVPKGVDAVDGPSAGLPMTIAAYSALTKKPTSPYVYATGAIDSNGAVSSVGGVYLKALAAAKSGARVIIVPNNNTMVSTTSPLSENAIANVNLQSQLKKDGYNVTVVGVKTINEALPYYFS
ncbi:MAG: S16 family serine protease [Halobacteriota archaeon]